MHKIKSDYTILLLAITIFGNNTLESKEPVIGCIFSHGISDNATQVYQYLPEYNQETDEPVIILFSHGIGDTHKLATVYQNGSKNDINRRSTIPFKTFSFDYQDARPGRFYKIPRISYTSLAQTNEILRLRDAFLQMQTTLQNEHGSQYKIVLYGLSRGASTIIMFLATYPELCKHVAGVVLESPFDSIDTIITTKVATMGLEKFVSLQTVQRIFQSIFKLYDPSFPSPIDVVNKIPYEIPILFVCTKQDTTVPSGSTKNLYQALLHDGHDKVHLIEVDQGKHGKILQGPDGEAYQNGVMLFYKTYGLVG